MKNTFYNRMFIIGLLLMGSFACMAFEKLDDGIVISFTDAGSVQKIKVHVCTDDIVRVIASPSDTFSSRKSLMVEKTRWNPVDWSVEENKKYILVKTARLTVRIHRNTGSITFLDENGKIILKEKQSDGKIITSANVMGENTFHIQQKFDSPKNEAFYGLGQHQNDVMNYKGHDVDLRQFNMAAVVPFIVSNKNYGILWDNNSATKFGDIREYQSLSPTLILHDMNGCEGGLTAEYFEGSSFDSLYVRQIESRIEHEFLDVNDPFPQGFEDNVKSIRWSGEVEARESGLHKFRLYCSGYTKMWIDDELIVDSWRQNWLPWTHFPKLKMKAGKRYKIRIEWIHIGGYLSLKCLTPEDAYYQESLSLYSEVADQIDYYFIRGDNLDQVISGYRTITGKAPMMPKWALGLWQCRERYKSQKELLDVVREFRKRNIPLDNIVQDWFYWKEDQWGNHEFDPERFPDPEGMIEELHDHLNIRIMISVWPKFYVGTKHFDEMNDRGYLYKRNVEKEQKDWIGYVNTFYDPYSEDSRQLFWDQLNDNLFSKGIDAWWLDATEPDIHSNLSRTETRLRLGPTAQGSFSRYLNTFSLMNSKGIYEKQREESPDQRVFILTRSAFAGQQRYAASTWSGDVATRWYDLKAQVPAGLNFCLSGIPYWTTDIGGFAVEPRFERNVKDEDREEWRELNTRWFQYGTFCPLFRVHGQFPFREIFNIASENHPAYQAMLEYDRLRYRLMPYIYSLTGMVTHDDYTIMRALVMDFHSDPEVKNIGDQFMFGPALLINPVTEYKSRKRDVYLPEGQGWYELKSGKYVSGGQTILADAPYSDIPIFVKEGSIIPFGPAIQYIEEKPADPIRLYVYTGQDGVFTLYEDENVNYNYEKGDFAKIPFTYNESTKTLSIGQREGEFSGMLKKRTFEIVWVDPDNAQPLNFDLKPAKQILYSGKKINVSIQE